MKDSLGNSVVKWIEDRRPETEVRKDFLVNLGVLVS